MKPCPFCQKEIQDDAFKCKNCGAWFTNDAEVKQKNLERETQAEKFLAQSKDKAGEELEETTQCFSVSTRKLVFMSLLTFGYYELYWFFRNWRAIQIQEQKKISPFWRSFFSVFFCYPLFKRILAAAGRRAYQKKDSPGTLAVCYIFLVIVGSRAPSPFDLIGILSFIPIIYVNNAVRFNNLAVNPQYDERASLTAGEIIFIIVGLIFWGLTVLAAVSPQGPAPMG